MHYGYVIEVIVKYCDNTSKSELDTAGQKCIKQRCIYMRICFLGITCLWVSAGITSLAHILLPNCT